MSNLAYGPTEDELGGGHFHVYIVLSKNCNRSDSPANKTSQGWAEPHVGQIQQGIVYSSNLALLALILAQFDLLKADFGCLNGGHLSGGGVVSALTTFESPA